MTTVSIQEAQANLAKLIHGMTPGDEVVITANNQPIARLIPAVPVGAARQLGSMRGTVLYMAPDFDAPVDDFKDYMQ